MPFFSGETMTCVICAKTVQSDPAKESNWRCIQANGWPFYACPDEFPPDNSNAEAFKLHYKTVLKTIQTRLSSRACRICACTEAQACISPDGACFWLEWDLCSNCGHHAAPIRLELDLNSAWCLISTIQLACRHPRFDGVTKKNVEQFARQLIDAAARTPETRQMLELGWDKEFDVPAKSRIITP